MTKLTFTVPFKTWVLVIIFLFFCPVSFAQPNDRIILLKEDSGPDDYFLQLIELRVGPTIIPINRPFKSPGNWLKEFRIRVKNISPYPIKSLILHFHLLERIDQELGPNESLKYVLPLKYGKNAFWRQQGSRRAPIKPGQVIELGIDDTEKILMQRGKLNEGGFFSKAEFIVANVQFKKKEWKDSNLSIRHLN